MKIAIIGGGFAGLSTGFKLLRKTKDATLHVYDVLAPGKACASSISGGLVHPITPKGSIIWKGEEAYKEIRKTLECIQSYTNDQLYQDNIDIIRPILKERDIQFWKKSIDKNSFWVQEASNQSSSFPNSETKFVVKIKNAMIIEPELYLRTLWSAIQYLSPKSLWHSIPVDDLQSLSSSYDIVVIAAGIGLQYLWGNNPKYQFFIKYIKGQTYICDQTSEDNKIRNPLLCGEYIIPRKIDKEGKSKLTCGATREHKKISNEQLFDALNEKPIINEAFLDMQNSIFRLSSQLANKPIEFHSSGYRVVTERTSAGKPPIVGKHPEMPNVWALSGLGSRGLLYHALMAEYLSDAILQNNELIIPKEVHPSQHYIKINK